MDLSRRTIIAGLVILAILVALKVFPQHPFDDRLLGVWKVESVQEDGRPARRSSELWFFQPNALRVVTHGPTVRLTVSVDSSQTPKHFDTDDDYYRVGIYEVEGDKLRVARTMRYSDRPTSFESTIPSGQIVTTLTRLNQEVSLTDEGLQKLLTSEFGAGDKQPEPGDYNRDPSQYVDALMDYVSMQRRRRVLSSKENAVYDISWFETEVNNGGFHQFFWNSTGMYAIETKEALQKIGAVETARLVEEGCRVFPGGVPPKDTDTRRRLMDGEFTNEQVERLNQLNDPFYNRKEDLDVMLMEYWLKEPQ